MQIDIRSLSLVHPRNKNNSASGRSILGRCDDTIFMSFLIILLCLTRRLFDVKSIQSFSHLKFVLFLEICFISTPLCSVRFNTITTPSLLGSVTFLLSQTNFQQLGHPFSPGLSVDSRRCALGWNHIYLGRGSVAMMNLLLFHIFYGRFTDSGRKFPKSPPPPPEDTWN